MGGRIVDKKRGKRMKKVRPRSCRYMQGDWRLWREEGGVGGEGSTGMMVGRGRERRGQGAGEMEVHAGRRGGQKE